MLRELIVNIVKHTLCTWEFKLLASVQRLSNLFTWFFPFLFFIWDVIMIHILQELYQSLNRIIFHFPLFPFIFSSIKGWVIWSGMISHPISHKFKEIRLFIFNYVFTSMLSGLEACQSIITIDPWTCNTSWYGPWNNAIWCILISHRGWNGIFIISTKEKCLSFQSSCKVQGGWKITFTGCSFSKIYSCNFFLICCSEGITWSWSLRNLSGLIILELLKGEETVGRLCALEP